MDKERGRAFTMRANADVTLRRGFELRERHGSWVKASREVGEGAGVQPHIEEAGSREADFLSRHE
jgi:hypothetical protein